MKHAMTIRVHSKRKGTIANLRAKVIAMDLEGKGSEAVNLLRITLNESMRKKFYVNRKISKVE
jgi:hypothetical protein